MQDLRFFISGVLLVRIRLKRLLSTVVFLEPKKLLSQGDRQYVAECAIFA